MKNYPIEITIDTEHGIFRFVAGSIETTTGMMPARNLHETLVKVRSAEIVEMPGIETRPLPLAGKPVNEGIKKLAKATSEYVLKDVKRLEERANKHSDALPNFTFSMDGSERKGFLPGDYQTIEKDLAEVINKDGRDNRSNTPDFILARFMARSLKAFEDAVNARDEYYGLHLGSALRPANIVGAGEISLPPLLDFHTLIGKRIGKWEIIFLKAQDCSALMRLRDTETGAIGEILETLDTWNERGVGPLVAKMGAEARRETGEEPKSE